MKRIYPCSLYKMPKKVDEPQERCIECIKKITREDFKEIGYCPKCYMKFRIDRRKRLF